jgi:branched-chain amino acid transport system substrate-binding protein
MKTLGITAALAALILTPSAYAADSVRLASVSELSGYAATAGTNCRNGIELAVAEINEKGGILGKKIDLTVYDSQSLPSVARAVFQKAVDQDVYAVVGPTQTGLSKAMLELAERNEVPFLPVAQGDVLTAKYNPYFFRINLNQRFGLAKLGNYIRDEVKARNIAVIWVNNDLGRGAHELFLKEMKSRNISIAADIATEAEQVDYSADIVKARNANPDAIFIYLDTEGTARVIKEIRKQGVKTPLIGETNLLSQKVIDLTEGGSNGVRGHISLTPDAPYEGAAAFKANFQKRFGYTPDHLAMGGYISVYVVKAVTEKMGKFDKKAFGDALRGSTLTTKMEPGIIIESKWDKDGEVDRESYLGEIVDRQQKIVVKLPPVNK